METWRWSGSANPLAEIQAAFSEMLEDVLGPVAAGESRYPRTELRRTAEGYEVVAALPGVKGEEVELSIEGGTLLLEGERPTEPVPEGARAVRRERFSGRFRRVVALPEEVDPAGVTASLRDGLLRVTLPRRAEPRAREIRIETERTTEEEEAS